MTCHVTWWSWSSLVFWSKVQREDSRLLALNRISFFVNPSLFTSNVDVMNQWSEVCEMGRPREAENVFDEMRVRGLKASQFEFRSILYAYGILGLFKDMHRIVHQMENEGLGNRHSLFEHGSFGVWSS
ncbi:hypothetical protein SLA2020_307150 [Shorea laevis]